MIRDTRALGFQAQRRDKTVHYLVCCLSSYTARSRHNPGRNERYPHELQRDGIDLLLSTGP